jgi:hypothetical protein
MARRAASQHPAAARTTSDSYQYQKGNDDPASSHGSS